MNTKKILLALTIACLVSAAALAQETPVLTIENGYTFGYSFSAKDSGSCFDTTVDIALTDKLQASIGFANGSGVTPSYTLLGLSYAILDKAGVSLFAGTDNAVAPAVAADVAGLGIYYNLFTRTAAGSLQTGLKLKLNYIAPVSDVSSGVLGVGLAATIGI